MQIKTIPNQLQKFKSFVYASVLWGGSEARSHREIEVLERRNSRAVWADYPH